MVKRVKTVIEEIDDDESEPKPVRRRLSWLGWLVWRGAILLTLLAALTYFAPPLLTVTGLWKSLLATFVPPLSGKVDATSLSLGWFSPIVIKDLAVKDENGDELLRVASLSTEKTLWNLATKQSDLGKIVVESPQGYVVLRADGSNVEDLLAKLFPEPPKDKPKLDSPPPAFSVVLTGGSLELDDQIAGRRWQLSELNADFDWPAVATEVRTGKLACKLKGLPSDRQAKATISKEAAGEIAAILKWEPGAAAKDSLGLGSGQATCELKSLPCEIAEGGLRRFVGDFRPAGAISGTLSYRWKDDLAAQRIELTNVKAPQLTFASPAHLAADRLSIHLENLSGGIELSGKRLLVDHVLLQSDIAAVAASASAELSSLNASGIVSALQSTRKEDGVELSGELDLAALASQLPATLRIRKDTRITDGLLQFSLESGLTKGERVWNAKASTSKLIAETSGRRFTWDQPLELSASARSTPKGFIIDQLTGKASFADLQGKGTLDAGSLTAQADLDKLVTELGQFVDWTGIDLAGSLSAQVDWQRGPQDAFTATADARVQNFQLAAPGLRPWQESDLQIAVQADGKADAGGLSQITAASLSIISGADKLTAQLQKPITQFSASSSYPVAYSLQGDLGTWLPRLQPFVPLAGWQISGGIAADGAGQFSPSRIVIEPTKIQLTQLVASSASFDIREPKVVIEAEGAFDQSAGTFTSTNTTLASSTIAFRADDVKATFAKEATTLSGHIDYRAKLDLLSAWLGAPQYPRDWQLQGDITGGVDARMESGVVQASLSTEIENLAYATRITSVTPTAGATPTLRGRDPNQPQATPAAAATAPWKIAWSEPKVSLTGEGSYDPGKDFLDLRSARFDSASLALAAAGNVEQLGTTCTTKLQGEIGYDLAGIAERLRPVLGGALKLTGTDKRRFSLDGPVRGVAMSASPQPATLVSSELTGQAGVGWQSAEYFGLTAGPTSVESKLEKGIVHIGPLDIPLSEGKLTAAPRIHLNEPGAPLVLDKGPLLSDIRISREMCHGWLKYVAPTLADATRAEGKLSVALDEARVPLLAPKEATLASALTIQQGEIGPGPLALQYLKMAREVRALVERKPVADLRGDLSKVSIILPEQQVPVAMKNGRVYHRDMKFYVKGWDLTVVTEGSVGLDDSLDLIAKVPIQDKWIEGKPLLAGLKGQAVPFAFRGHISGPTYDATPLAELGKKMVGSAAKGLLQGEMKKGKSLLESEAGKLLDKVFGKP